MIITEKLLSRDDFRNKVFQRDNFKCIFCNDEAKDAHHIIERRLFSDGGYYLSNGATVCEVHHLECEKTNISVEEIREKLNITKPILPEHFYDDQIYDKWGNIILSNGNRLKGELFFDESVQKILKDHLDKFVPYVKYCRTYHLPWSQSVSKDDKIIKNLDNFINHNVVVTEKMDGENTSLYKDYYHARSIDSGNHESRNWCKNFWSSIKNDIPDGWRICGENLYAKHSIQYNNLDSYFYGFSIWDERNNCLSWEDTIYWFKLFNIINVPILYEGKFDEKIIKSLYDDSKYENSEGYVVRICDSFKYGDFKNKVAKFVRKNHINTTKHWFFGSKIEKNTLKENK